MRRDLQEESLAGIVLGAPRRARPRARAIPRSLVKGSPAAIVLGPRRSRRAALAVGTLGLSLGLHFGAAWAALAHGSGKGGRAPEPARRPVVLGRVVDLAPPPPLPTAPRPTVPRPATPTPDRPPVRARPTPAPAREAPPPPAAAGRAIAASPADPLDFTGFDLSTADHPAYVGGVTATSGTGTSAQARVGPADGRAEGSGRARPVGNPREDWRCPWPLEAEPLSVVEQVVALRVVVRVDGTVASSEVVSDPGYGFGAVAAACARRQRFSPATDGAGRPIPATSPLIHVTFTRR